MINALVQHGEQTAVIELPLDMLSLRYDLSQIGIRTLPKDIPISDDEAQPIQIKLYSDSDIGSRLAVLFNSRHSLEEANLCAHKVENAHPAIREDMKSRILNGQYYSPKAVMADITEMTEGLIAVKVDYYCPLQIQMCDEEYGELEEVNGYYGVANENAIRRQVMKEQERDLNMLADFGQRFNQLRQDTERFVPIVAEGIRNAEIREAEQERLMKTVKGQLMSSPQATFDILTPYGDIRITPDTSKKLLDGEMPIVSIGGTQYADHELLNQPITGQQADLFNENLIRMKTEEAPELEETPVMTM